MRDQEDLWEGARQLTVGERGNQPARTLLVEGAQWLVQEEEARRGARILRQRRQREGQPQRQRDLITRAAGELLFGDVATRRLVPDLNAQVGSRLVLVQPHESRVLPLPARQRWQDRAHARLGLRQHTSHDARANLTRHAHRQLALMQRAIFLRDTLAAGGLVQLLDRFGVIAGLNGEILSGAAGELRIQSRLLDLLLVAAHIVRRHAGQ